VESQFSFIINSNTLLSLGAVAAQWLRCCAANWKVADLILDGVIGIFH